jgi:uncharacterized protein with GYD domain
VSTYIALVNHTDQGIANVKDSRGRLDQARALLRETGGDFRRVFLTMGVHDLVVVDEAPDDATAARFALRLGMLGYVRTTTLKAFPEAAYRDHRPPRGLSRPRRRTVVAAARWGSEGSSQRRVSPRPACPLGAG